MARSDIKAGLLRYRLTIYRYTERATASTLGQPAKSYTASVSVWGSIQPMTGKELFTAQQVAARVTHKLTMRGGIAVSPKDVITARGRNFEIDYVMNIDEADTMITCYGVEVPA